MKRDDLDEIIDKVVYAIDILLLLIVLLALIIHKPFWAAAVVVEGAFAEEPKNEVVVQEIVEPTAYYELTAEERDLIERVVMSEAGGEEYIGQQAVAQCILNACELWGARPAAIIDSLGYATYRENASQSVKDAVSAVFDYGVKVLPETAMYFYAPDIVYSEWHETQIYLDTIGCHKFFARRG